MCDFDQMKKSVFSPSEGSIGDNLTTATTAIVEKVDKISDNFQNSVSDSIKMASTISPSQSSGQSSSSSKKIKATDLPVYFHSSDDCSKQKTRKENNKQSQLETYVTQAREGLESYVPSEIRDTFKSMGDMTSATKTSFNDLIAHIQNSENQASRAAFVTSSGFIGYLLGGKGIMKRSLFGIIALGGSAAICEPKIAKDYAEVTFELVKSRISDLYEEIKNTELVKNFKIPSLKKYLGFDIFDKKQ